jgi:hypothetical protein
MGREKKASPEWSSVEEALRASLLPLDSETCTMAGFSTRAGTGAVRTLGLHAAGTATWRAMQCLQ